MSALVWRASWPGTRQPTIADSARKHGIPDEDPVAVHTMHLRPQFHRYLGVSKQAARQRFREETPTSQQAPTKAAATF